MFKELIPLYAGLLSAGIAVTAMTVGWLLRHFCCKYGKKHENDKNLTKVKKTLTFMQIITLIAFFTSGVYGGNAINTAITWNTAIKHGMTADSDTGEYNITYGEMIDLNDYSIKETGIDINNLKNQIVIYVRYDCPDCIYLHDELSKLEDVIFLSSRTDKGKAARELYNINLTEIPQGVYIDPNGNATLISIVQKTNDGITLDMDQIEILRDLKAKSQ